jgi:phage shock protein PspC (stress-responsive transcriptional regulator)
LSTDFKSNEKKTNSMSDKKLLRSNNRVIAGVCAGLAEYLGWEITVVRIVYLVLSILSAAFPGILVYIILWIVMPKQPG